MSRNYKEILHVELETDHLSVSAQVEEKLASYCSELMRWNQKLNLTSLTGESLVRRLVIEPISIGQELAISGTLVDIGSGNGSPAIPLCLSRNVVTHCVEVRSRRAAFLRHVVQTLSITNAIIHRCRFEDVEPGAVQGADWITLQAVAPSPGLIKAIKAIHKPTTTVVWITSSGSEQIVPVLRTVRIPQSTTEARIVDLDQS